MKIAIFGSGGVGGYFGGRLAQAGHDVTFIARGDHLRALQHSGIHIISPLGDFTGPANATNDPSSVGIVDLVLVGTKAWQVAEAGRAMQPMIGEETAVIPLQNGVDAPSDLMQHLGERPVMGGLCRILSHVSQPGTVTHAGADPTIVFGELDGTVSDRGHRIHEALDNAPGMHAELTVKIHHALWRKFLFMPPASSLSAATRAPLGVIRQIPETREMLVEAMREVHALAIATGVDHSADEVEKTMSFIDTLPGDSTPSMQRDIVAGKPSELEAQPGAVVRIGTKLGIAVPVHQHLYQVLLPLELRARGKITW